MRSGTLTDIRAADVNLALKQKYSGPEWRIWFEVSQSTGYNSGRRADAVVMNIWPSKKFQLHVFEVKVSRSDFKNEMANLGKWQAIGKYADFFWLACPVGLVAPDEVPSGWGLIELTKAGLRIKKQAPANTDPTPIDRAFAASLLRSGEDLTEADIQRQVNERLEVAMKGIRDSAEQKFAFRLAEEKKRNDKHEAWAREFEETFGCKVNTWRPPQEMVDRINLATKLDTGEIKRLGNQAKSLATMIDKIEH